MPEDETPTEHGSIAEAAALLAERVETLGKHLTISQRQLAKVRNLTRLLAGVLVLVLVGLATTVVLYFSVRDQANANHHTQIQVCQNGNDSRTAQLAVWAFFIALIAPHPTPEVKAVVDTFEGYLSQVYRAHDCSDLNKPYPVPTPPTTGR